MNKIIKIINSGLVVIVFLVVTITAFFVGYVRGYNNGYLDSKQNFEKYILSTVSSTTKPIPTSSPKIVVVKSTPKPTWGGPQLWDAVNKRRVELGVNPLSVREEICTIASIRLNQLLELGKL